MKKTILFLSLFSVFNLSYAIDLDINNISKSDWEKMFKEQEKQEKDFEKNPNIKKPENITEIAKDYFNKNYEQYTIPHSYYSQKQKLNGYLTCFVNEKNESESIFTVDSVVMAGTLEYPETKPFSKAICGLYKRYENEKGITIPKENTIKKQENKFIQDIGEITKIKTIINEILKTQTKDEFTKKAEVNEIFEKNYVGKEYFFISESEDDFIKNEERKIKYDAEKEVFKFEIGNQSSKFYFNRDSEKQKKLVPDYINYILLRNETKILKEYVGSNVYGVKANVTSSIMQQYGLAISNNSEKEYQSSKFNFELQMKPNEAREIKDNISLFYKVEIINDQEFKDKILEENDHIKPKIDSPTEIMINKKFILVKVKEIGIFNKKTGQVLFIKKTD